MELLMLQQQNRCRVVSVAGQKKSLGNKGSFFF